jgi:hypothetical protein
MVEKNDEAAAVGRVMTDAEWRTAYEEKCNELIHAKDTMKSLAAEMGEVVRQRDELRTLQASWDREKQTYMKTIGDLQRQVNAKRHLTKENTQ